MIGRRGHDEGDTQACSKHAENTPLNTANPFSNSTLYYCQGWQLHGLTNSQSLITEIKMMPKSIV